MYNAFSWLLALLAVFQLHNVVVVAQELASLCGQYDDYNSTNPEYPFLWIPNAWGDDGSGGSCLNVTEGGAAWDLQYKWTGTPTLVKQYAHMKLWPSNVPVIMSDVSHLQIKATWSTIVEGTESDDGYDEAVALNLNQIWSNVAVDMFLSTTPQNVSGANPPIEIMIWPWYSIWVRPLGWQYTDPNQHVVMVDNTNFSLYSGYNDQGQHVFSWLAQENMTSTDADYAPLIKYIWEQGMVSGDLWLAQLEFGTEVLHAAATTLFSMSNYTMKLIRSGDPDDYSSTTATSSTMTSTTSATSSATMTTSKPATTTSATHSASSTASKSAGSGAMLTRPATIDFGLGILFMTILNYIF